MEMKDRIKKLRTALGITQSKFAAQIAVVSSYISEIENGVKEVNERAIRLIISTFNVNEAWLRTGEGNMFRPDDSAATAMAMGMFKSLSPDFQHGALQLLETLTKLDRAK